MLESYRWIVGCTLIVGFLGGTFVYAKSTEAQQQISKRNRDNTMVLTIGSHGVGPFYSVGKSYGLTDPAENDLFDIFCSAVDTEWLRPTKTIPHLPFNDFEAWAQNARCQRGVDTNCAPVRERWLERHFEAREPSIINRRVYEYGLRLFHFDGPRPRVQPFCSVCSGWLG